MEEYENVRSLLHEGLGFLDRQGLGLAVEFLEETALVSRMACADGLLDLEKQDIAVAVDIPAHYALQVAAGFSLEPELLARPAPVVHKAGFESLLERFVIEPGEHQNAAGRVVPAGSFLHDRRDESVGSKFEIEFHSCRLTHCRIIRNTA